MLYKYLEILQANGSHREAARKAFKAKYLQRLRATIQDEMIKIRRRRGEAPSCYMYRQQTVEILQVAANGWTDRMHRGANHGSTGTDSKFKINGGQGLPHQAGLQVQAEKR